VPDWDEVYSEKNIAVATPTDVLLGNEHLLPTPPDLNLRALDYACGLGANSIFLADHGFQVSSWDLSEVAVKKINQHSKNNNLKITAEVHDLENSPPTLKNQFDVIVVSYFLHRATLRVLYDLLKTGGLLFYQTFSGDQVNGQGPSRKSFRLNKNELLNVFSDMQLLYYREDDLNLSVDGAKPGVTYFVAKK